MKEVVFFDMDGTIIKGQSQMYFLTFLRKKKIIGLPSYLKIILWFMFYKIGLVKSPRLILEYFLSAANIKNISRKDVNALAEQCFSEIIEKKIFNEAREIIREHIKSGREVVLLSNSVSPLVEICARYFGGLKFFATELEETNGLINPVINGQIIYGQEKVFVLKRYIDVHGFSLKYTWAYADHYSDIPVLSVVEHPFVVNPDKKLLKKANKENWPVLLFKGTLQKLKKC